MATKLYFGNLPNDTPEDSLRALAASAGKIESIELGRQNRFAYVTYVSPSGADAALKLAGRDFGGRELKVEVPKPKETRPPRAAAGGASGEPLPESKNAVVVRGLPRGFDKDALRAAFADAGAVRSVGFIRGLLGRVTFEDEASASRALAKNGTSVDGTTVTVERAHARVRRARAEGDEAPVRSSRAHANGGAGGAPAAPKPVRRVRVDGLGANTTEEQLTAHFGRFGRVEGVKIIRGEHAFVSFDEEAAATKALGATGSSLNGGSLAVSLDTGRTRARRTGAAAEGGAGARRAAPEPEASNTLWIGGLPQSVTEAGVRAAVARYAAQIDSITVQEARGGSTKFAYVVFKTVDGAVAASGALQGVKVEGTEAKVALAQARRTGGRRE